MGGMGGELGKGGTDGGGREGGGRKGGGCDGGGVIGGAGGAAGGGSGEGGDLGALPGANGGRHGVGGYGGRGGGENSTLCIAGPNHSRARHERPANTAFSSSSNGQVNGTGATDRVVGGDSLEGDQQQRQQHKLRVFRLSSTPCTPRALASGRRAETRALLWTPRRASQDSSASCGMALSTRLQCSSSAPSSLL